MRVVFRFEKDGPTQYIAHLDLMRAMHRALRRAGLPAKMSQGFHPHIVMSFAQALGLGYLSRAEYMEITLPDGSDLPAAMTALNGALPSGLHATGVWALAEGSSTLMASVAAARWHVALRPEEGDQTAAFAALLGRETVPVMKQGKKGETLTDIRPGLLAVEPAEGGVELLLSAGSVRNIRPETVVRAALGRDADATFTRLELYAERDGALTPLSQICTGSDEDE